MNRLLLILIALFTVACSTPRPVADNTKVRSGEETAKTAADAARDAESKDNTGVLVASSNGTNSATTQPTTMPAKKPQKALAPPEAPTLRVRFVKGTLTQSGEPIVDFARVCADAVARDADVVLLVDADESTPHKDVMTAVDTAKKAGIQKFTLHVTSDDARKAVSPESDDEPEAKKPPKQDGPTKKDGANREDRDAK